MELLKTATSEFSESRDWLAHANLHQYAFRPASLDYSAFDSGDHYPNSYLVSGIILGRLTGSPFLYAPYVPGAATGAEIAVGPLWGGVDVSGAVDVVGAVMYRGDILDSKLPGTVGSWTNGGVWDDAAAADCRGRVINVEDITQGQT